ncbi:MAG TPA: porin [Aquabacterium sp.]|uniref:porin n=1 Tax=Aquabacterium sp. TaxID=1872578 RepID=UPI002E32D7E5|nr:porin [Aquabacterium sp.]HEX5373303.1 porin [Aquabacterium sp.]
MKKSLIALAALGTLASAAMAQSSVTVYGIIDLGLVKQNRADAEYALGGVGMQNEELNVAQATKSRIGFRGVEDLGGGLSAKFGLEHRLQPDVGATNTSGGNQFWDMSIVGLTSQTFGEITLGRDYGPTFYAQYLLDPWLNQGIAEVGGTSYAFAGYNAGNHQARLNDAIFYKAKAAGFTFMAAASMSEKDGTDNRYAVGAMYEAGPLFLTAAYDQSPSQINNDETDTLFIIGGAYDFGAIKPRVSFAQSKIQTPFGGEAKPKSFTLAATAPLGGGLLKVGYTQIDWDNPNPLLQAGILGKLLDSDSSNDAAAVGARTALLAAGDTKQRKFSLGYEYSLSKRTAIYTDVTSGKTKNSDTVTGIDLGIRHAF